MITHPSAQEILQAITSWIEELRPQLDERNAFLARVAINALATVDRELAQGESAKAQATARLARLLDQDGDYDALTRELCARLRAGEMTTSTPELLATLRANLLAQLRIDQPAYRHTGSILRQPRG